MPREQILQLELAKSTSARVADEWQRLSKLPGHNILRDMRKCRAQTVDEFVKEGLPLSLAPVDATIGDIYPGSIKGKLENDFLHLLGDLYLDPRNKEKYLEKAVEKQKIEAAYADRGIFFYIL